MKIEEACRLLNADMDESEKAVKNKYRKLMFLYHPDTAGDDNETVLRMAQKINEAYEVFCKNKPAYKDKIVKAWSAKINEEAYSKRPIYIDYSFLDKHSPVREAANGRYLWDPHIEEFAMLMKSVHNVCQELLESEDRKRDIYTMYDHPDPEKRQETAVRLFHMLMQEYIEPISCVTKIGEKAGDNTWMFDAEMALQDRTIEFEDGVFLYGMVKDTSIIMCDADGVIHGRLSFNDDSMYYVITPLVENDAIQLDFEVRAIHSAKRYGTRSKADIRITVSINNEEKTRTLVPSNRKAIDHLLGEYRRFLEDRS